MKWHALVDGKEFIIRQDTTAGFYLYIFEGGECTYDYLQDTFELAQDFAFERFGVGKDRWMKATAVPDKKP